MGSLFIDDDLCHHSAVLGTLSRPGPEDPHRYQHGFGNHHASEAFAGALPRSGTNLPQKHPYGLYAEHLNGTSFVSSRESVANVQLDVSSQALGGPSASQTVRRVSRGSLQLTTSMRAAYKIESCFLPVNPNVDFTPLTHTWGPLPPRERSASPRPAASGGTAASSDAPVTFVHGLRTVCGHGDPTLKEGLAVHVYAFDADMARQALVNNDGDFLVVPQRGTLDLQTELGYLRVPPGSVAVIPAGLRFAVSIAGFAQPHGAAGYVLEIFGAHFALPDLGPLGGNALAHVRDFQYPVASFDLDFDAPPTRRRIESAADWRIVTKLAGRLHAHSQPHTPFDVVAWHGRYAPYKYDLGLFGHLTANTDQLDPTAYCVLTAPSKWPGVSLVDFCVFGEKYAVARNTLRVPYHHRTMATEIVGIISGQYTGSVRRLEAGGLSFEQGYMAHGESYECWRRQSERLLGPEVVGKDCLGFMFHVSSHVGLTKWATERHPDIRHDDPALWDDLGAPFIDKLGEASRALDKMRLANEAAIQAELTALAFEVMANQRRLSLTDEEGDDGAEAVK